MVFVKEHAPKDAIRRVGPPVMEDVLVVQCQGVAMHVENHVRAAVLIVVEIHVVRIVQIKLHTNIVTRKTVQLQTQKVSLHRVKTVVLDLAVFIVLGTARILVIKCVMICVQKTVQENVALPALLIVQQPVELHV